MAKMTLEQAAALCVRVGHMLRTGQQMKDKLTTGNMLMQAALCIDDAIKEREAEKIAAPTDIALLLAEVRRLQKENAYLKVKKWVGGTDFANGDAAGNG